MWPADLMYVWPFFKASTLQFLSCLVGRDWLWSDWAWTWRPLAAISQDVGVWVFYGACTSRHPRHGAQSQDYCWVYVRDWGLTKALDRYWSAARSVIVSYVEAFSLPLLPLSSTRRCDPLELWLSDKLVIITPRTIFIKVLSKYFFKGRNVPCIYALVKTLSVYCVAIMSSWRCWRRVWGWLTLLG